MAGPKILAVSYAFPPMAYPRSIQVSRLLSSLHGTVQIVCGSSLSERRDETIFPAVEEVFPDNFKIKFGVNKLDLLRKHFLGAPDEYIRWVRAALKSFSAAQHSRRYSPDIVITFGMPMSDHIFGLEYKKITGVPWIAHFSDPWADNPYLASNTRHLSAAGKWERAVINRSDGVIFTSPETLELVMRKYPASWKKKAHYLPHSYDPDRYESDLCPPDGTYVIRHLGNFYGLRSPEVFFEAIESIAADQPVLLEGILIEFFGSMGRHDNILANYPNARKVVSIRGPVPYAESLRLMQSSHCLLVFDAPGDHSVFFPSKLADYLGSQRFVLAVSPQGATSRIVKESGGSVAPCEDPVRLREALMILLRDRPECLIRSAAEYEKSRVAEIMDGIIRTLCARG